MDFPPPIPREKCRFISKDDNLPWLALAVRAEYQFVDPEEWQYIDIQTAGERCNHHYLIVKRLTARPKTKQAMKAISGGPYVCNKSSDPGCINAVTLRDIVKYNDALQNMLGVSCNETFRELEEAIYPIDCSASTVRKLAEDKVPDNLNDLIVWPNEKERMFAEYQNMGTIGIWRLYILGSNSD